MRNDLQVNQHALILNVEKPEHSDMIGRSVLVKALLSTEESKIWFRSLPNKQIVEPYALVQLDNCREGGILQRYLMPLPPLDDECTVHSYLINTPEREECLQ